MKIEFESRQYKGKDEEFMGWRIFQMPKPTHIYAIGVDVAEGKGRDASCAQIIDINTGELVANFWSPAIAEDNFAAEIYKSAHFYNRARVIIEENNSGHAVITSLSGVYANSLRYPYLYKRYEYDEFTKRKTKTIGWRTTAANKANIINNLRAALRDGDLRIVDKHTISELSTFVKDEKTGKLGAKGSSRDDRIMSLALAWEQCMVLKMSTDNSKRSVEVPQEFDPVTGFPI